MEAMEITKAILRKNLKELRDLKGWSQEDLAEATDYTRGYIADVERGKSWVSPEAVEAMAKALGVDIGRLFSVDKPKLVKAPMSSIAKRIANVPDGIYDVAEEYEIDKDLEIMLVELIKKQGKKRKVAAKDA
jgi:transcriptional regulator with XRE-family HTH domain